jgi:hypothetical protein
MKNEEPEKTTSITRIKSMTWPGDAQHIRHGRAAVSIHDARLAKTRGLASKGGSSGPENNISKE